MTQLLCWLEKNIELGLANPYTPSVYACEQGRWMMSKLNQFCVGLIKMR